MTKLLIAATLVTVGIVNALWHAWLGPNIPVETPGWVQNLFAICATYVVWDGVYFVLKHFIFGETRGGR